MQSFGGFGEDFGTTLFLARNIAETHGLEQATELSGQNRCFRGHVIVEEVRIGIVDERCRPNYLASDYQGSSHKRLGVVLRREGIFRDIQAIEVEGTTGDDGIHGDSAVRSTEFDARARKALFQKAGRLTTNHLVGRQKLPKVAATHAEEFTRGL